MDHVLRELRDSDVLAARALWENTEGVGLSAEETPQMLTGFLLRNPSISSAVLNQKGELLGALLGGHDGRRGYLYHLAVDPAHQGRGLGRALVQRTIEALAKAGIAKSTIMVYASNKTGSEFWRHLGWHAREDLEVWQCAIELSKSA